MLIQKSLIRIPGWWRMTPKYLWEVPLRFTVSMLAVSKVPKIFISLVHLWICTMFPQDIASIGAWSCPPAAYIQSLSLPLQDRELVTFVLLISLTLKHNLLTGLRSSVTDMK